jgi:cyclic pyranopterin monophosphate synthase
MSEFTHLDQTGHAHMVNVGEKPITLRRARAQGFVRMSPLVLELIHSHQLAKGDPLGAARLSGILAAKQTSQWIPLCHNIPLDHVRMEFSPATDGIRIEAEVSATARTGVEMEALSAVAAAALTIYDMCKAVDRDLTIGDICLLEKEGGRSGHYLKGK